MLCALKFKQKLLYAKLLGEMMGQKLAVEQRTMPELLIPVPLHVSRLRERGCNQALELAKPIAKMLNMKLDRNSVERVNNTAAQSTLPFQERKRNLKNAFVVKKPLCAKHVAIVDDVMTTGSTVEELSRVLRSCGVLEIEIWCCARVIL